MKNGLWVIGMLWDYLGKEENGMMKKISILIVLAMIVTIGGVYATWNYAMDGVDGVGVDTQVTLTEKVVSTSQGTIDVDASGLSIVIDDANNDYHGELVIDGQIDIEFTADPYADATVKTNGLPMQYELSVTTPWEHDGVQIFTVDSNAVAFNGGAGTFTATITAAELMAAIDMCDVYLPTTTDYDEFAAVLTQGEITITVSEIQ